MSSHPVMTCYARREGDRLILSNSRIERTFAWNGGDLVGLTVTDKAQGITWSLHDGAPCATFPGHSVAATDGELVVQPIADDGVRPAHLRAEVTYTLGTLQVRRRFELFDHVPAIACRWWLRGRALGRWSAEATPAGELANIEDPGTLGQGLVEPPVIERLLLLCTHLEVTAVQFFDVTDRRNNLVAQRQVVAYPQPESLRGNLLIVRDMTGGGGLFLLKESPCSDVQLADPGYDFGVRRGEVTVAGIGLAAADVGDEWVAGYGCTLGVGGEDEQTTLCNLRDHQRTLRTLKPGRDHMVMLNTWGDRGQDGRISHAFALREIERAAALGLSHFQLDDGWQAGQSSNSATSGGSLENIWRRDDYWHAHPQRFPQGLGPIIAAAKEAGVELCVWFNPSKDDSYANWRRDADTLIQIFRGHGIRTFKIDGVNIPDKRAELNLRAMFDAVMAATDNQAVFNLDVTAGRRFGYHYFTEYGNIFLENRYTDWGNYYPHWTLRNLWMLSKYVPAPRLQIEFLNNARNPRKYADDDPLAPSKVPLDYCFAITMMAQPLAWMEASNLTDDQVAALAPVIKTYREHQQRIHAGTIVPIGGEPDGFSWTGFMSMRDDGGYIMVYREANPNPAWGPLLPLMNRRIAIRSVMGAFNIDTGIDSTYPIFKLADPFSFSLCEYQFV